MDTKAFVEALGDLEHDKGIPQGQLLEAVERAIVSAYKGKYKVPDENIVCSIDSETGDISLAQRKTIVEEVEDDAIEVELAEVLEFDDSYAVGEAVEYPIEVEIEELGRIAAQTAKQVVVQTVRDIERGMVFDEYSGRQGELITGNIQRVSGETVFVTLGRTEAIMSPGEQVRGERYTVNNRMKFFIMDVKKQQKGPQIFLSRSHPGLVMRLFELEVPEIREGIITIDKISREAGSRTKMAVLSNDESVDPVGACVGNRGTRVQAIVDELFGEKIDIIPWSDDQEENISSALSPAKVEKIVINEEENTAVAVVPDYQLSLAIGKEGQNVRLAAKLCGIKIDIKSHTQYFGGSADNLTGELDEEGYLNPDDFEDYVPPVVEDENAGQARDDAAEDVEVEAEVDTDAEIEEDDE